MLLAGERRIDGGGHATSYAGCMSAKPEECDCTFEKCIVDEHMQAFMTVF